MKVNCRTDSSKCDGCICEENCEKYKIELLQRIIETTIIERPEYITMDVNYLL